MCLIILGNENIPVPGLKKKKDNTTQCVLGIIMGIAATNKLKVGKYLDLNVQK